MDAKDSQTYPRDDVGTESLRPVDLRERLEVDDGKHEIPINEDKHEVPTDDDKHEVPVDDEKHGLPLNTSPSEQPILSEISTQGVDTQADSVPPHPDDTKLKTWARWALFVMAFFMGDVQDGLGPFLGVYLQQRGWAPGLRGSVSTVSGVATIIATGPIGALIDATSYKRLLVAVCALLVGVSQGLNLVSTHPALVFITQIVSAVAGTSMMPLLVALTLGVCDHPRAANGGGKVKHSFRALNGWNQAANHAGNMVSAGLAGLLGARFGLTAVFWLVMAFCAATMGCVLLLPERAIDHAAARGGPEPEPEGPVGEDPRRRDRGREEEGREAEREDVSPHGSPTRSAKDFKTRFRNSTFAMILKNRPLGVVAITIFLFHLGNASILFLYGQALVAAGQGDPAGTTGLTVIIAQGTMVIVSILTSWLAGRRGYWFAVLISYAVLPVRAAVAGRFIKSWGVWPVQILDGIGAGIQSVAIQGLIAVMMAGSGRVNVTFGIVGGMTRQTGAAISHSLGGWMAEARGYSFALYLSGIFPLVSLAIWIGFFKMLRQAMDRKGGGG